MSKKHAVLSEVHRLLSFFTEDELLSASRHVGLSRHLVVALNALAEEASSENHQAAKSSTTPEPARRHRERAVVVHDEASLVNLIMRSRISLSTQTMLKFAANFVKLEPRAKENRERTAKRFAQALRVQLSPAMFAQVIKLLADTANSQTEGWVNVIRRKKN